MKALLKNHRQSPRKVRLVANLVRGKNAILALENLSFTGKRASDPIAKLIRSAISNAKREGIDEKTLFIKEIQVGKGITLKRFTPRAFGRATAIHKHSSHVRLSLESRATVPGKDKKAKKAKKTEKAVTEKK